MKNKRISKILAGTLAMTVILNSYAGIIKIALADETVQTVETIKDDEISDSQLEQWTFNTEGAAGEETDYYNYASPSEGSEIISEESVNYSADTYGINENSVYLSDLDYYYGKTEWKEIMKDANTDGTKITLKVGGDVVTFNKGLGAHATSTVIYDVSAYSNVYTQLSTYLGVDYSKANKGCNGVNFYIYTSQDGQDWQEVEKSLVVLPEDNATYVNLNITGVKYVKLYAHNNGQNGLDHAVYGDLRLLKTGYDIESEKLSCIKQIFQYDEQIKAQYVEGSELSEGLKRLILEREFVDRFGYNTIQQVAMTSSEYKEALQWIFDDTNALALFIEAGTLEFGTAYNTIDAWCRLYTAHKEDLVHITKGNIYKKLMIATAVALSRNIQSFMTSWGGNYRYSDAVLRYELMKNLYDNGRFLNYDQFNSLSMELVRSVVDARLGDDEVLWLRNYTEHRYPDNVNARFNPYNFVSYIHPNYGTADLRDPAKYAEWDAKYLLSENNVLDYGVENMPKIWMEVEKGGICWGISGFGSATNEVHGIPSINIYQPQHEAYLQYSEDANGNGKWSIGNVVYGWDRSYTRWAGFASTFSRLLLGWGNRSYNSDTKNNASYILLGQAALNDYENYLEANYYNFLAKVYEDDTEKQIEIYNKALEKQSFNLDALEGLAKAYKKSGKSSTECLELAKRIIEEYTYYPLPMVEILGLISDGVTNELEIAELDILKTRALMNATNATNDVSLQPDACKTVAKSLLGTETTYLATFSFDGENAGKIILNEKYRQYTLRVRYSFDGGVNYKETNDQVIQLTEEEIAQITAEKDIIVGLVGTTETYTIDIQQGKAIGATEIYNNDLENKLIGSIENLEISLDGGKTWCNYTSEISFNGNQTVKARYKASGVTLAGLIKDFTFTEDNNTDKYTYLPIKHISLYEYSSQQSDTFNHAAKNFIDGTPNTAWHTKYNTYDDKYYSVKFDSVRYISKLTYLPGGPNGRLKAGKIYTSMDGENWDLAFEFSGLENNTNLQTIDFGEGIEGRYLKIVATENYGNSIEEGKMYFSGKMLNFYEDTTKTYEAEASIEYSTTKPTNGSVVAKLVLPEGCEAIGDTEHTFDSNGTFEFKFLDANGNEQSIIAKVTNIDKVLPTAKLNYNINSLTNQSVIVTLEDFNKEGITVANNNNSTSYTFDTNGKFDFELVDAVGNKNVITAEVTWIDKDAPKVTVKFNTENPTNGNVIATIEGLGADEEVISEGGATHTFTDNGYFEFVVKDKAGNKTIVPVNVNWIDRKAPTATVKYDVTTSTYEQVKATLSDISEAVTILNPTDGSNYVVFDKNGTFTFEFIDKAGNKGTAVAEVNWIVDKPTEELPTNPSKPGNGNGNGNGLNNGNGANGGNSSNNNQSGNNGKPSKPEKDDSSLNASNNNSGNTNNNASNNVVTGETISEEIAKGEAENSKDDASVGNNSDKKKESADKEDVTAEEDKEKEENKDSEEASKKPGIIERIVSFVVKVLKGIVNWIKSIFK